MTTEGRYDSAKLECDLVMKGGITSGVVYPLAVCRVAEKYRLCNIGGASAGAIAAVAAGAAEFGRVTGSRRDGAGFAGLETLPEKLTAEVGPEKQPRLLSLFQPTDEASPLFALLLTAIGKAPAWQKPLRALAIVFAAQPHAAVLGLIAAAGLIATARAPARRSRLRAITVICGALALLLLGVLGSIAVFVWKTLKALGPGANYGICSGYAKGAAEPALTQWLTEIVDQLAGVDGAAGHDHLRRSGEEGHQPLADDDRPDAPASLPPAVRRVGSVELLLQEERLRSTVPGAGGGEDDGRRDAPRR